MTVSRNRLQQALLYDNESGIFRWKVDGRLAGTLTAYGYVRIEIDGKPYLAHRLAWLWVHGMLPTKQVDHINRDRLDNRIENLREASNQENSRNKVSGRNRSGRKGVRWHKRAGKWAAAITINAKEIHLGLFDNLEAASAAYDAAAANHFGQFRARTQ
jgi:hypothetical protein